MRAWMFAIVTVFLLGAAPASAAPTCVNRLGDTVRCATQGAMPVGWTPSPQVLWDRQLSAPPGPRISEILKVVFGIGLFLAMIALLPDFDSAKDWDRQENDSQDDD